MKIQSLGWIIFYGKLTNGAIRCRHITEEDYILKLNQSATCQTERFKGIFVIDTYFFESIC